MASGAQPLFRPQALAAQRQALLGPVAAVQLSRPWPLAAATAAVALAVLALIAFLASAQYTRRVNAAGVLVPERGLVRLLPAAAGQVLERHVKEGQAVQAGQLLFVLGQPRGALADAPEAQVRKSLAQRESSLAQAALQQGQLQQAHHSTLLKRQAALERESLQLQTEGGLHRQRIALAEQALARLRQLEGEQFISAAQVQAKQEELLGLRALEQAAARQHSTLEREMAQLQGELKALPLQTQAQAGTYERERALLARESAEWLHEKQQVIRAPQAGTVSAITADVGQAVSPGAALASVLPAGAALQAQLFVPSSAVGFIRQGQVVLLRYEAYPYQRFGQHRAEVLEVSRVPLGGNELALGGWGAVGARTASEGGAPNGVDSAREPLFRITAALAPQGTEKSALALSAGMRLWADVQLERRSLLAWLFEPLLAWHERARA